MKKTTPTLLLGGVVVISMAWAMPAFADSSVVPPSANNPNACVGQGVRYTTQNNNISPFTSAQGIGHVAKANNAPNGSVVVNTIRAINCPEPMTAPAPADCWRLGYRQVSVQRLA